MFVKGTSPRVKEIDQGKERRKGKERWKEGFRI